MRIKVLLVLVAVAVFAAGCGSKSKSQDGAIAAKDENNCKTGYPCIRDYPVTTTSTTSWATEETPTTTTTEAPTTTTTVNPDMTWLDAMEVAGEKVLEQNRMLQLGESNPPTCRSALKIVNTISVPKASAKYALADKYFRDGISTLKESLNFCIKGDLEYHLRYLQLSNRWMRLSSDNLS